MGGAAQVFLLHFPGHPSSKSFPKLASINVDVYGETELSSCVRCSYLLRFLKCVDLMFSTLNFKSQVDFFFSEVQIP